MTELFLLFKISLVALGINTVWQYNKIPTFPFADRPENLDSILL